MENWITQKKHFEVKDVRQMKGNFLPAILQKAKTLNRGEGLCIVQSFEPIPLYAALKEMGYEHVTDKISETEYRAYFYRIAVANPEHGDHTDMPLKPTAIVNFNTIDPKLAHNVVNFWNYIWGQENPAIDMETRLLLSLANGVGAGRMRQATREFVKAYSLGVEMAKFDELFAMFAWNQGVGYFASEIGPSALFAAYKFVKTREERGDSRTEILRELTDKFGENNPEVGTFFKQQK